MIDRDLLNRLLGEQGIALPPEAVEKLDRYAALLVEWNEKMNLTAITDPFGVTVKHMADSLTLLPLLPQKPFSLIDVGTGAGFPGIPLAIARPDMRLTLLDGLNKRLVFLETVCAELGIPAERVHARAEEAGRQPALRERFDVATARAVASLPTLCEYCLPFVKVGGQFLAMKGRDGEQELATSVNAINKLGGKTADCRALTLPEADGTPNERRLIVIKKVSATPAVYPRHGAKITKSPL